VRSETCERFQASHGLEVVAQALRGLANERAAGLLGDELRPLGLGLLQRPAHGVALATALAFRVLVQLDEDAVVLRADLQDAAA